MGFTINWTLDEEEPLVQESLLGSITLDDGQHQIKEDAIWLDSWLDALIQIADVVWHITGVVRIEIEDPQPLTAHWGPEDVLKVSFKEQVVTAGSLAEFTAELRRASEDFLRRTEVL